MKHKIILLLQVIVFYLPGVAMAESSWPGSPPDCWKEPRNVHNIRNTDYWKTKTEFKHAPLKEFTKKTFSINQGYHFVREGLQDKVRVYVYSEKDYLIAIHFKDLHGLHIRWINEKLLFLQPWWGRIAGTDIIYDV